MEFLAAWEMKEAAPEWWKLRARLGIGSAAARFFPYWRPGCPARTSTANALLSAYAFDGKVAVLVIANTLPTETPVAVRVELAGLGWPPGAAPVLTDERTGARISWNDGQPTVPVKGLSYTLVSLRRPPSR